MKKQDREQLMDAWHSLIDPLAAMQRDETAQKITELLRKASNLVIGWRVDPDSFPRARCICLDAIALIEELSD
jgi:hypothetical protein